MHVSCKCTLETYVTLLINVTPIHLMKINKQKKWGDKVARTKQSSKSP